MATQPNTLQHALSTHSAFLGLSTHIWDTWLSTHIWRTRTLWGKYQQGGTVRPLLKAAYGCLGCPTSLQSVGSSFQNLIYQIGRLSLNCYNADPYMLYSTGPCIHFACLRKSIVLANSHMWIPAFARSCWLLQAPSTKLYAGGGPAT